MEFSNMISRNLNKYSFDAILITSLSNRRYATGFPSTGGFVLVTREKSYFFTDSRYTEAAAKAIHESEVIEISGREDRYKKLNDVLRGCGAKRVGFEENDLTWALFRAYEEGLTCELHPAQELLSGLRAVKTREELDIMIKAQRIAEKSFNEILGIISTDITEKDLASELLYRMLKNGAEDSSFDIIVVSGVRSSMPHGVPEDRKIQKGFLTIDFGAKVDGYCSDTTRTLCIGQPTDEMKKAYDTVLEAQAAGISAARANIMGQEIDKAARDVIYSAGYEGYFGHAFGHSLGLDIHESPNASPSEEKIIPAGAVISAEPGIYIPGKFGIRIEDVIYITPEGCENITRLPKELTVIQ
ncbi:MAG: M24 family metallopeptidase [Oscillospiraceae bacterium]